MTIQDPDPSSTTAGGTEGDSSPPGAALRDGDSVRQLLDLGPDALLVLDRDLRCRWANGVARPPLGRGEDETGGPAFRALAPPLSGTPVERAFRAAIAEGRAHTIRRVIT